jgi:hypothetical protein
MLNFWSVVLYDVDTRCMIINPQGKTEVNSRQPLVKSKPTAPCASCSHRRSPTDVPEANWIQTNPEKGLVHLFPLVLTDQGVLRPLVEDGQHRRGEP